MGIWEGFPSRAGGLGDRILPVAGVGPPVPGWVADVAWYGTAGRGFVPGMFTGTSRRSKNVGAERSPMGHGAVYRAAPATKRPLLHG